MSLLIGTVTTIAVAWVCALWISPSNVPLLQSLSIDSEEAWSVWMVRSVGAVTIQRAPSFSLRRVDIQFQEEFPRWSKVYSKPSLQERYFRGSWVEDARGWPLVCVRSERQYGSGNWPSQNGAIVRVRRDLPPLGGPSPQLPLQPIWPAFAANTAVFTAIWLCVISFPLAVRRTIRAQRGRCTSCGYDRRYANSERCSECGHT
jgi:hypothetical protein